MNEVLIFKGNQCLKNLGDIDPYMIKGESLLSFGKQVIESNIKKLEHDAEIVSKDKVILHLNQVFLFMIRYILILDQLIQNFDLDQTLNGKFFLVLYDLDGMQSICPRIDTFHHLAKCPLPNEIDNLVLSILG